MATTDARQRFNAKLDAALDKAKTALEPLFDTAYSTLSTEEIEVLHELMFKLGAARTSLIHGDFTPEQMEQQYQQVKAERSARFAVHRPRTAAKSANSGC